MTDPSHAPTQHPAASDGPEPNRPSGRGKLVATIGTGAALAGALTYVGLNDPHRAGSLFPQCIFKLVTGLECPACGGLRMTHDLLHGDVAAAVVDNVYLLVLLPLLAAWFLLRRWQKRPPTTSVVMIGVLVSAVAWGVVRNLPGFPLVPTILTG